MKPGFGNTETHIDPAGKVFGHQNAFAMQDPCGRPRFILVFGFQWGLAFSQLRGVHHDPPEFLSGGRD